MRAYRYSLAALEWYTKVSLSLTVIPSNQDKRKTGKVLGIYLHMTLIYFPSI